MAKLSAVIVKGDPRLLSHPLSAQYYRDIEVYLKQLGVNQIAYCDGKHRETIDIGADVYVVHTYASNRCLYFTARRRPTPIACLGDVGGLSIPQDDRWLIYSWENQYDEPLLDERLTFCKEQREAVRHAVETACKRNPMPYPKAMLRR